MLKGKYVGETEKKIMSLFNGASQMACDMAKYTPGSLDYKTKGRVEDIVTSIIFIDEVDSLAPSGRGEGGAQGQITASAVNTMLQVMDGANKKDNVVVVAATNFPQALDEAFRRRFLFQIPIDLPTESDIARLIHFLISKHVTEHTKYDKMMERRGETCGKKIDDDCDDKIKKNVGCIAKEIIDVFEWKNTRGGKIKEIIEKKLSDDAIKVIAAKCKTKNYSGADVTKMFSIMLKYSGRNAMKTGRFMKHTEQNHPLSGIYYSINCLLEAERKPDNTELVFLGQRKPLSFRIMRIQTDIPQYEKSKDAVYIIHNTKDLPYIFPQNYGYDEQYVIYSARKDKTNFDYKYDKPTGFLVLQFNIQVKMKKNNQITHETVPILVSMVQKMQDITTTKEGFWPWLTGRKTVKQQGVEIQEEIEDEEGAWFYWKSMEVCVFGILLDDEGKPSEIVHETSSLERKFQTIKRDILRNKEIPEIIEAPSKAELVEKVMNKILQENVNQKHEWKAIEHIGTLSEKSTMESSNSCKEMFEKNMSFVNWELDPSFFLKAIEQVPSSHDAKKYQKFLEYKKK